MGMQHKPNAHPRKATKTHIGRGAKQKWNTCEYGGMAVCTRDHDIEHNHAHIVVADRGDIA